MINIFTYPNYQVIKPYNQQPSGHFSNLQPLKRDTVSFTSKNLLKMSSKELTKEVKNAVVNNTEIGYGAEGVVYKIPQSDYCIKIFNGEGVNNLGEWDFNVSSQDKINHVVARAENGSLIMKQIKGEALKWDKPDEIYDLPLKSYRDLLIQISNAGDECLQFDSVPSNLIYNKKDKTLTAIDFFEPNPDIDLEYNPLQAVFKCLHSSGRTPKDAELNKKLGINLLTVVKDELQKKEPEFQIDRWDAEGLLYDIYISQNFKIPKEIKQPEAEINKHF